MPAAGTDALFDLRIGEPPWGEPLTLMMAGLTALDTGLPAAMALGRVDLAHRLAERKCGRVERFGNGAPEHLMEHMAAYVTVSGGLSLDELRKAARAESEAIGRVHPGGWGVLADAVAEAAPGPVQPDVVGEALLLRVWGADSGAVVRAARSHAEAVAAGVMRTAQDFCVGKTPRTEPLAWVDALIEEGRNELALLLQLEGALPVQTLALRERAVEVDWLLAAALRSRAETDEGPRSRLARVLNNLGVRLSELGRREAALEATEVAVGIYRELAAQRPDAFRAHLASSLNNLGVRLSTPVQKFTNVFLEPLKPPFRGPRSWQGGWQDRLW